MKFAAWLLLVFIAVIVIFIIFYLINRWLLSNQAKHNTVDVEQFIEDALPHTGWSFALPENNTRGQCNLYTFTSEMDGTTAVYNNPSLDFDVLNAITPSTTFPTCIAPNQIVAQLKIRTCVDPDQGYCVSENGTQYQIGEAEQIYTACKESVNTTSSQQGVRPCLGQYAQIVLNFNRCSTNPDNNVCLQLNGINLNVAPCDIGNSKQFFNVKRYTANTLQTSSTGPFASIQDIVTGNCIVAVNPVSSGSSLTLGACAPNNGAVWWLIPAFKQDAKGPQPGDVTAQQLVYTTNIMNPPNSVDGIETFLTNNPNKVFSMSSSNGSTVTLQPYDLDLYTDTDSNSQIISYEIFNEMFPALTYSDPSYLPGCCPNPIIELCTNTTTFPYYTLNGTTIVSTST